MVRRADRWQTEDEYKSVSDIGCAAGWDIGVIVLAALVILFAIVFEPTTLDNVWIRFTLFEMLHVFVAFFLLATCIARAFFTPAIVIVAAIVLAGIDVFVLTGRMAEIDSMGVGSCTAYCVFLFIVNILFILSAILYCCFGIMAIRHWGWWGDADFEDDYYGGGSGGGGGGGDDDNESLLPTTVETKVAHAYPGNAISSASSWIPSTGRR